MGNLVLDSYLTLLEDTKMALNLTRKIIMAQFVDAAQKEALQKNELTAGTEIGLRMNQTLTQDATGTMAYLQFEAMGVDKVCTDLSVSYVDHNTLQMGFRNPDDHRFAYSGRTSWCYFLLQVQVFATSFILKILQSQGTTLVGSDSHTPTAGGIGALAMGAGGLSMALAMAGAPYVISMPRLVSVRLLGKLTGWASAKDIILKLLGMLSVKEAALVVFLNTQAKALQLLAFQSVLPSLIWVQNLAQPLLIP